MDRTILLLLAAIIVILGLLAIDFPHVVAPLAPAVRTSDVPNVTVEVAPDAPLPAIPPPDERARIETELEETTPQTLRTSSYFVVTDSCGAYFDDTCLAIRSGPSASTTRILSARNGMVLPIDEVLEHEGHTWYRIVFREWLRFPERVTGPWYVASEFGTVVEAESAEEGTSLLATTTKRILIDRSEQTLYAYDGETLFMEEKISTGLQLTPTPRGEFTIYRKTPSRYMQGPLAGISNQYFDLPGVPWNLYFTQEGGAIHGTYWHDHFGHPWSHGCVNLPPDKAKLLYEWAPLGTKVTVRD